MKEGLQKKKKKKNTSKETPQFCPKKNIGKPELISASK